MKKAMKVLCLMLVMIMVMSPLVMAGGFNDYATLQTPPNTAGITKGFSQAAGLLQIIGYGVAVVMIIWLGVNYLIATPAKKAELKGKMWSMAIGIVLIVGGVTILKVVASIADGATKAIQQ